MWRSDFKRRPVRGQTSNARPSPHGGRPQCSHHNAGHILRLSKLEAHTPPASQRYLRVKYGKCMSAAGVLLKPNDRVALDPNRSANKLRCLVPVALRAPAPVDCDRSAPENRHGAAPVAVDGYVVASYPSLTTRIRTWPCHQPSKHLKLRPCSCPQQNADACPSSPMSNMGRVSESSMRDQQQG